MMSATVGCRHTTFSSHRSAPRAPIGTMVLQLRVLLSLALVVLAAGCSAHNPASPTDLVNAEALAGLLQHAGAEVRVAEQMPREAFPFFGVSAQRLIVNDETVHVFVYADLAAAAADASLVPPSGTPIGGTHISWVAPPRFYTRGALIVLYVGRKSDVINVFDTILGPAFAGVQ